MCIHVLHEQELRSMNNLLSSQIHIQEKKHSDEQIRHPEQKSKVSRKAYTYVSDTTFTLMATTDSFECTE